MSKFEISKFEISKIEISKIEISKFEISKFAISKLFLTCVHLLVGLYLKKWYKQLFGLDSTFFFPQAVNSVHVRTTGVVFQIISDELPTTKA